MEEDTYKPCHQSACVRFQEYEWSDDYGLKPTSDDVPAIRNEYFKVCKCCRYFERFNLFTEKE